MNARNLLQNGSDLISILKSRERVSLQRAYGERQVENSSSGIRLLHSVTDLRLEKAKQLDLFTKRIERAWFLDVFVGACFQRRAKMFIFRIGRHHD